MDHGDPSTRQACFSRKWSELREQESPNAFLRERYIAEFNRRFQVRAAQSGNACVARHSRDLDLIFALQFERTVNRDKAVRFQNLTLQIEVVRCRASLAGVLS